LVILIGLFLYEDFWKTIFWLVLKLEISYRIIISWRILASFSRITWGLYFFMVKYLSFHNSSFAFRYFFKSKWQGHTVRHNPCCISLEVVWDIESFQIGCNSTAWLYASQSSPSKAWCTWQIPDKHSVLNILLLLEIVIHDNFWGSDAMAQWFREGRSHFERIVEHMGIISIYPQRLLLTLGLLKLERLVWRLKVYLWW
jgi:hypothetical protein